MSKISRIENATRNIFFGYLGNVLTILLGFIARSVFIHTLGTTYLGVNGLYTNILSVLSLAELGIGTAMNYSLYKPVAEQNHEKIKTLMNLYKRAYMIIAFVVLAVGLVFVPFLKYVIKDPGSIGTNELIIYYLIFLFNTVTTYFVAYKYSLINAEQKGYIQTNIQAITTLITVVAQIIILLIYKNFLLYLLIAAIIGLMQKIYINIYLNKLYPYLLDKKITKLSKEEIEPIKKNITALMYHKIGDISVHQTDNIIISSFVNVTAVGLISNYNLIITSVSGFINIIFNSMVSGIGNLIATENQEKHFQLFKVYRFLGFWFYGLAAIAFYVLLTPFITLWIGKDMVIGKEVISLILLNYYFQGHRIVINNFKTAAGVFNADKHISIAQALVNLVVSIALVQRWGLTGVYIGTVCAGLVSTFTRPYITYKVIFNRDVWEYYKDSIIYIITIVGVLLILELIKSELLLESTVLAFTIMLALVIIIPNIIFYILFRNRQEYKYLSDIVKSKIFKER